MAQPPDRIIARCDLGSLLRLQELDPVGIDKIRDLQFNSCPHCGSSYPPVWMKPEYGSAAWQSDPEAYLACPKCHTLRALNPLPAPHIPPAAPPLLDHKRMAAMTESHWNSLFTTAAADAAGAIWPTSKGGHALERDLEMALVIALASEGCQAVVTKQIPYEYPGWHPQPGPLDLGVYDGDHVVVACELNLHEVDWGLYDLLKIVSLFRAPKPASAAYLVTGAKLKKWPKTGLGGYFEPGRHTVGTIDLLRANPKQWADLMYIHPDDGHLESSGRPVTVPSELAFEGLGSHPTNVTDIGELRVMSVRPAGSLVEVPEDLRKTNL